MVDLGTLGGDSTAFAVNNSGQVVGVSDISGNRHAFSWTRQGGMVDLGTLEMGRFVEMLGRLYVAYSGSHGGQRLEYDFHTWKR